MKFRYSAKVVRVVDGDTLDVEVDLGLRVFTRARVRLNRINAPEKRTREGMEAHAALSRLLPVGSTVTLQTFKDATEKYGRWLADVWSEPMALDVNQEMLRTGHSVAYEGRA